MHTVEMNVCGFIVASSEKIRLQKGAGLFLTVYNICLDIHFHILIFGHSLNLWEMLAVNHYYCFTQMKIGMFEMSNGDKKTLFKTSLESTFTEIIEQEVFEFKILDKLKKAVSVLGLYDSFYPVMCCHSKLVSYQGFVTKVKDSSWGIYELDFKVMLYVTFNTFRSTSTILKVDSEVFASNVHYITNQKGENVLVCCGLSSVRSNNSAIKEDENIVPSSDSLAVLIHNYPFNIFDLLWLEEFLIKMNLKFSSSIIDEENFFRWDSEILSSIFMVLSNPESVASSAKQISISEDYFSCPHICSVFSEDILPNHYIIPCILEILDESIQKISWKEAGKNWKYSYVHNQTNHLLIGMVYLSENGRFYIADKSCELPIVFTKQCAKCNDERNILCQFNNLEIGFLVILQEYGIIFEETISWEGSKRSFCYITAPLCYLSPLAPFSKVNSDMFHLSSSKTYLLEKFISSEADSKCSVPIISDLTCYKTEDITQHFLVVKKIWSVHENITICCKVLVIFLFDKINNLSSSENGSFINESYNFYGTDDDFEFADLVNQMDNLFLGNKSRLVYLFFDSPGKSVSLFPGHMYSINLLENFNNYETNCSMIHKKDDLIRITSDMTIIHDPNCMGTHYCRDFEMKYCSIQEIVAKRSMPDNCVIKAILLEKIYEKDYAHATECEQTFIKRKSTLCLIVRDCATKDSLRAYIPFYPKCLLGLLPGVEVELYGFLCICSRKGFLYLKPSSAFDLQITSLEHNYVIKSSLNAVHSKEITADKTSKMNYLINATLKDCFRCLCFVSKVISAEIYLICSDCMKAIYESCTCFSAFTVKVKASILLDDGTKSIVAFLNDQATKQLLKFTEEEWKNLVSYVIRTKTSLIYHEEMREEITSLPLMNQIFCFYCCSKLLCRPVFAECQCFQDSDFLRNKLAVWCNNIIIAKTRDLFNNLYRQLQN